MAVNLEVTNWSMKSGHITLFSVPVKLSTEFCMLGKAKTCLEHKVVVFSTLYGPLVSSISSNVCTVDFYPPLVNTALHTLGLGNKNVIKERYIKL